MMTRSVKKISMLLIAVIAVVYVAGITVGAVNVPDLDRMGSVSVTMQDPETGKGIKGETLAIYCVADVHKENDADYSFALTEAFTGSGEDLSGLGNEAPDAELAGRLNTYRIKEKINGTKLVSDDSGRLVFDGLKTGLYLVAQETVVGEYYEINPFLISIPLEENGELIYDVEAAPKMEIEKKPVPEKPSSSQTKTGDSSHIALWGVLLIVSTLGVSVAILYRRRKK